MQLVNCTVTLPFISNQLLITEDIICRWTSACVRPRAAAYSCTARDGQCDDDVNNTFSCSACSVQHFENTQQQRQEDRGQATAHHGCLRYEKNGWGLRVDELNDDKVKPEGLPDYKWSLQDVDVQEDVVEDVQPPDCDVQQEAEELVANADDSEAEEGEEDAEDDSSSCEEDKVDLTLTRILTLTLTPTLG